MSERVQTVGNGASTLAEDARALMAATADVAGEKIREARARLAAVLDSGHNVYGRMRDRAVEGAKIADKAVHQHPYQAIAISLALGALVGFLAVRLRSRGRE